MVFRVFSRKAVIMELSELAFSHRLKAAAAQSTKLTAHWAFLTFQVRKIFLLFARNQNDSTEKERKRERKKVGREGGKRKKVFIVWQGYNFHY